MAGTDLSIGLGVQLTHSAAIAPPAGWTPGSHGDLIAWYDPSDVSTITESGGEVSQLDDKSGNAYHITQPTAINQPNTGVTINSLGALYFDGGDHLDSATLSENVLNPNAVMVLLVFDADTTSQIRYAQLDITNTYDADIYNGALYGHANFQINPASTLATPQVFIAKLGNTAASWTQNGVSQGLNAYSSIPVQVLETLFMGSFSGDAIGKISEYAVFGSATSESELESYAMDKWIP